MAKPAPAPTGDLGKYEHHPYTHQGSTHRVYQRGSGPAVLVITEMPGITSLVVGFADRLVAQGFTALLPDIFDNADAPALRGMRPPGRLYTLTTLARVCVRQEFTALAVGHSSPIVDWLRALAAQAHQKHVGPGVGVVAMCFSGGFALALATLPCVLAPVLAQPSLPMAIDARRRAAIDCSSADLERVRARCDEEGLRVLGLRFRGDPIVPASRFENLRTRLGDGFVAIELPQEAGHPRSPFRKHHCVLTLDLIDEPGEPTRDALDDVLAMLRVKLRPEASEASRRVP